MSARDTRVVDASTKTVSWDQVVLNLGAMSLCSGCLAVAVEHQLKVALIPMAVVLATHELGGNSAVIELCRATR